MKTADELTAITIDFLAEHTNEAMAAVVLGVFWHLIWERPKHLLQTTEIPSPYEETDDNLTKKETQLRGNLKKEMQLVLHRNEELERIVRELQSKLEGNDQAHAYIPLGMQQNYSRKRTRKAGLISTTIGMTTNEVDGLVSCWGLLVFGFCMVATRRTRKRYNPLSTTVVVLEKVNCVANGYTQENVFPALIKIWMYLADEFQKWYSRITDPESSSGKAIATAQKQFRSRTGKLAETIETVLYGTIIPVSTELTKQGVKVTHRAASTIAAFEMPKWKEQPPTILLVDHEEGIKALEVSLKDNESQRKALQEKLTGFEQALKGKEILLYEERMKTRSAKLEAAKVTLEREETRRKESRDTEASALSAVAEDQRRILRSFLSEHLESRQQQERLRKIDKKSAPKKSTIVLPNPILQGFASTMYINNLSDLSNEQQQPNCNRNRVIGAPDCRDDGSTENDEYYGNPNENRLREIKEQFRRSKTMASSLRPSSHIDSRVGNKKASTGSLLWNAANPATIGKDCTSKNRFQTRAAAEAASQEPSSWMEDPASLMCDWRMAGNEEEMRE